MAKLNEIAATLMRHLVEHDWHGYTWGDRWGDGEGVCPVTVDGRTYNLNQGDRDCSSAIIDVWSRALEGTPHDGKLSGATYTGNMRSVFTRTGLFEWKPMSFTAQVGDIYLNEANHTAMCVSVVPDLLAEFSQNEFGGCYGGQVGDQTGRESSVHGYYDYPWDGILHYIGGEATLAPAPSSPSQPSINLPSPRYRVYTYEDGWLEWMNGFECADGCGDDYAGIQGHVIRAIDIDLSSIGNGGWFQVWKNDRPLAKNDTGANDVGHVTGITVYYETPEPAITGYYAAKYRVAPVGADWLKWELDDDDDGAGGAGAIDRMQLTIERV